MHKIFLSASGQSANTYHCGKISEKEYCESLVDLIIKKLPSGIKAYYNHNMAYYNRPIYANKLEVEAYITIHTNGFNGKARGLEIGISKNPQDEPLALAIYSELVNITPSQGRGLKNYNFIEATAPTMPSCYLELSFHDNHDDEMWLINNKDIIANSIIKGISNFLNIKNTENEITLSELSNHLKLKGITKIIIL